MQDSGKVIGYILLREEAPGVLEMGWVFHRAHWGQGYAQEACRAALDAAFAQRGAHKVFAETIDAGRSVRLMRRLGMVCEGVQRAQVRAPSGEWADLHLYGILREFDGDGVDEIYSEAFASGGIGAAVMNRLLKAAGHQVIRIT